MAREAIGHSAPSKTMEKHYNKKHYEGCLLTICHGLRCSNRTMRADRTESVWAIKSGDIRTDHDSKPNIKRAARQTLYEEQKTLKWAATLVEDFEDRKNEAKKAPELLLDKMIEVAKKQPCRN